jgi:hypothetical protein
VTEAALLAVVDAVAWDRSLRDHLDPAVDLTRTLGELGGEGFEEFVDAPHVKGSPLLQQIVGLERLRRRGKISRWGFVQVTSEGTIRISVHGPQAAEKMVVLHA